MYFFLKHFSFLETLFTTDCIPRFLYSLSTGDKTISYNACVSQLFFIFLFGGTEFFLLAIMSYDRYVAICKPLNYATIMNSRVCVWLVTCCWIAGWLVIFPPLCLGLNLEFCDSNVIDHFLCDASAVLKISCSDTQFIEQMVVTLAVLINIVTFLCHYILHIHHQCHPKVPFLPAKTEDLFYLLYSLDCGFYHLWQLYFHLCQTLSKSWNGN